MATEQLIRTLPKELTIAVVELDGSTELSGALQAQHVGKVLAARAPQEAALLLQRSLTHVVVLSLPRSLGTGLQLLRSLAEDSCPPRTIVLLEAEAQRRKLSAQLEPSCQPHLVLIKSVPLAELIAAITVQAGLWRPNAPQRLFPEVLAELWQTQRTGVLRVTSADQQTTIYLRQGRPVFAEGGSRADLLGHMLVESGRISKEQLSRAVELVTHRPVEHEQLQLGSALIELGVLTIEELYATLSEQVHRKILACFAVDDPLVEFRDDEEQLEGVTEFSKAVPALLLLGISQKLPAAQLESFLTRYLDQILACCSPAREVEQSFGLGGRDRRLLDLLAEPIELRAIYAKSPLRPERTKQLLMALLLGGAVKPQVPSEAPEPDPQVPDPIHRTKLPYGIARKKAPSSAQAGWARLRSFLSRVGRRHDD